MNCLDPGKAPLEMNFLVPAKHRDRKKIPQKLQVNPEITWHVCSQGHFLLKKRGDLVVFVAIDYKII